MFSLRKAILRSAITALALLGLAGAAQAVPISIFNTGVDGAGAVLPDGTLGDPHYSLISVPSGTSTIRVSTSESGWPIPPWLGDNTLSRWIGPNTGAHHGPAGTYVYRTTFDLSGLNPLTAVLSGGWATDNAGDSTIWINGVATGITSGGVGFGSFTPFSISSGFISGVNTLDFLVVNADPWPPDALNPTGLRVEISGTAAVPVTGTLPLLGLGLAGLLWLRRKVVA